MSLPISITLRGVQILLSSSPLGWSAQSPRRGYFPLSDTGSLSLHSFEAALCEGCIAPSLSDLERIAVRQDAHRAQAYATAKAALDSPLDWINPLANFIRLSAAADDAGAAGFFAPAQERAALWRTACLLYSRILTDRSARPSGHLGPLWPADLSDSRFFEVREALACLRCFLEGRFSDPLPRHPLATWFVRSYFSLPAVSEPAFDVAGIPLPPEALACDSDSSESWESARPVLPKKGGGVDPF
jgi:hypothetical protein